MAQATITIQKSDDASLNFTLKNADGSAYSGGGTLTFTVKRSAGSTVLITRIVSATATITFNLTESELDLDVRAYRYELVVTDGLGNRRTSGLNAFYVTENNASQATWPS